MVSDDRGVGAALAGVRVLELGHGITVPFATRLLADFGADVVKVERSDGDFVRHMGPFARTSSGERRSALFEYLNWNKRSVQLDLADPAERSRRDRLVEWADIVFLGFRPSRLTEWRLDSSTLRAINASAVICAVSNFGLEGVHADDEASDLIFQATGGVMYISGSTEREPLKAGLRQTLYCAGLNAAYATLAAYRSARLSGGGVCLDLAIRDCVASQLVMNETYYAFMGAVQGRRPPSQDPLNGDPLPTADGFASIQLSTFVPTERLVTLFDEPRLADARFSSISARVSEGPALRAILEDKLRHEHSRDFFTRASEGGHLVGFAQGATDLLSCPQLAHRRVFEPSVELVGRNGEVRHAARLVELSETPTRAPGRAPGVGEHNADTFRARRWARPASRAPARAAGPLVDLRVLDLSTVFAVPYIGGLVADMGAEVIKIESPRRLDQSRSGFGGSFNNDTSGEYWNRSTAFHVLNRGKRAMCVDLARPEGQDLLRSLVAEVDILLENFTPRVMRNWGTTYEKLAAINPRLIMLSNTGYGGTGPWSSFKSQGTTLEATMGLTHYSGYPGGKPMKIGQSYPDFLACWTGLVSLMAALVHRDRTGRGQHIDVGMYQLGAAIIPEAILGVQTDDVDPPRQGNRESGALVSDVYRARGDDRWLAVSVSDEAALSRLADLVPGVAEAIAAGREGEALLVVDLALAEWVRDQDAEAAAERLQRVRVAAGPVYDASDLLRDEHLRARGFYETADYGPDLGPRPLIGRPYRWAGGRVEIRGPGPDFAEGNRDVLERLLGLDEAAVGALVHAGVLSDAPVDPPHLEPHPIDQMLLDRSFARVDPDYRSALV